MRAAVFHGPRDVRIESVPEPADPEPGDVVLEVLRAAICGTDSSEWDHGPILCTPGVVLGHEFVGRVVAAGSAVTGFRVGDRVVSGAGISCGHCAWCRRGRTNLCAEYRTLGLQIDGGLARYVTSPAAICRPVPDAVDDDAAAMTQPLAVALHALSRAAPRPDDAVAVIGAGGIGSFILAGAVDRSRRRPGGLGRRRSRAAGDGDRARRDRDGRRHGPRPARAAARAVRRGRLRRGDRGQRRPARARGGDRRHAPRRPDAAGGPARRAAGARPHRDDRARGRRRRPRSRTSATRTSRPRSSCSRRATSPR